MLSPNRKPLSNEFYNIYIFNFIYRTPDVYIQKKKNHSEYKMPPLPHVRWRLRYLCVPTISELGSVVSPGVREVATGHVTPCSA